MTYTKTKVCFPNMHPHTKFGIPTSKNIGDMHLTQSEMDGQITKKAKVYIIQKDTPFSKKWHKCFGNVIHIANHFN